jgi:hypothetical protein
VPLTGQQVEDLVNQIVLQWDLPTLTMFLRDRMDVKLNDEAPDGSLRVRAATIVHRLNGGNPPRHTELLVQLRTHAHNHALAKLADELLNPTYFSPTGDVLDAILLGSTPFVDRKPTRELLCRFVSPTHATPRVLVVRGKEPSGKSYTWEFLRHLAYETGATPQRLRLADTGYTPHQVAADITGLLGRPQTPLPPMADNPQKSHFQPLVNSLVGLIPDLPRRYWLVLDDLNHDSVDKPVREFAYALAVAVEDFRHENLHLALLGYNEPIIDAGMRARIDHPRFPDARLLAEHLTCMAAAGDQPLPIELATRYAELLLERHTPLTKEAMQLLTDDIRTMGHKLREGARL